MIIIILISLKKDDSDVSTNIFSNEVNQKSEPTKDRFTYSLNFELLQILKSLFEQITKHGKECDIKEFLSKFNDLIRLPHVQVSIKIKSAVLFLLFKNQI